MIDLSSNEIQHSCTNLYLHLLGPQKGLHHHEEDIREKGHRNYQEDIREKGHRQETCGQENHCQKGKREKGYHPQKGRD